MELMGQTGLLDLATRSAQAPSLGTSLGSPAVMGGGDTTNVYLTLTGNMTPAEGRAVGQAIGQGIEDVKGTRRVRAEARMT